MNILIVEDEPGISDFLTRGLRAEGYSTLAVGTGEAALDALKDDPFQLVILDVMLPAMSGHEVCAKMRFREDMTPILMLTALGETGDKIAGLRKGADDYMTKPFDFDELLARIEALIRRSSSQRKSLDEDLSVVDELVIDSASRCVFINGRRQELAGKEFDLIYLFNANRGRVLSRERILNSIWSANADPLTNTVDVHISRLRKKLGDLGDKIVTVHGIGYRFD